MIERLSCSPLCQTHEGMEHITAWAQETVRNRSAWLLLKYIFLEIRICVCGLFVKIDVFSRNQRGLGAELHCLSMKVGKGSRELVLAHSWDLLTQRKTQSNTGLIL